MSERIVFCPNTHQVDSCRLRILGSKAKCGTYVVFVPSWASFTIFPQTLCHVLGYWTASTSLTSIGARIAREANATPHGRRQQHRCRERFHVKPNPTPEYLLSLEKYMHAYGPLHSEKYLKIVRTSQPFSRAKSACLLHLVGVFALCVPSFFSA